MKATDKIDAARVDLLLGELRLPGIKRSGPPWRRRRQGRLARRPIPGGRRTGDGGAKLPPLRTASGGSDRRWERSRYVRLHRRADDSKARRKRSRQARMARKGSQSLVLRAARAREIRSRSGARSGLDREGLARPLHQNHDLVRNFRSRAAISPRSRNRQKSTILSADPRRLADVTKDQAETSVLFESISARYERPSC